MSDTEFRTRVAKYRADRKDTMMFYLLYGSACFAACVAAAMIIWAQAGDSFSVAFGIVLFTMGLCGFPFFLAGFVTASVDYQQAKDRVQDQLDEEAEAKHKAAVAERS